MGDFTWLVAGRVHLPIAGGGADSHRRSLHVVRAPGAVHSVQAAVVKLVHAQQAGEGRAGEGKGGDARCKTGQRRRRQGYERAGVARVR